MPKIACTSAGELATPRATAAVIAEPDAHPAVDLAQKRRDALGRPATVVVAKADAGVIWKLVHFDSSGSERASSSEETDSIAPRDSRAPERRQLT